MVVLIQNVPNGQFCRDGNYSGSQGEYGIGARDVRHPETIGSLEADKIPVEMTMLNKWLLVIQLNQ